MLAWVTGSIVCGGATSPVPHLQLLQVRHLERLLLPYEDGALRRGLDLDKLEGLVRAVPQRVPRVLPLEL